MPTLRILGFHATTVALMLGASTSYAAVVVQRSTASEVAPTAAVVTPTVSTPTVTVTADEPAAILRPAVRPPVRPPSRS